MVAEWQSKTIADITSRVSMGPFGSNIKTDNFVESGVPVIRGNNLTLGRFNASGFVFLTEEKADELRNSNAFPGDVVFTHRGTLGQVGIIPSEPYERYVVSQSQMVLTCDKSQVDPLFLYYFFKSPEGQHALLMHTSQTGVPAISRPVTALKAIRVHVPPLPMQKAIAFILSALDDKIELNNRTKATLETIAKTIFKSWFLDFQPVRAKMNGKAVLLPNEISSLFPDRLEDSELGPIPVGWSPKSIEEVTERVVMGPFGSSIKVETFVSEGIPIVTGQQLRGLILNDQAFNFISVEHAKKLGNAVVERGDIVLTHRGNLGQAAFIPATSQYERYVISQSQFSMRCDRSQVTPSFMVLYFNSLAGQHQLLANTTSSGVPSIARPVTYLRSIKLVVPERKILNKFEQLMSTLFLRLDLSKKTNDTLGALRDMLLPKLISGELQIKDAERFITRVL